jgi:hypothetical protein
LNVERIEIESPKRNSTPQTDWEVFFPYYAGYREAFARSVTSQADLSSGAVILDPWNGSGTTTYVATQLGLPSLGLDLNPVMVVVARARLLPPTEADSICALAQHVCRHARTPNSVDSSDPLSSWFTSQTVGIIRSFERSIRRHLVGELTVSPSGIDLDHLSGLASTFYVALFAVCRGLIGKFKSSNPTWLRRPKADERKISASRTFIRQAFLTNLMAMAAALEGRTGQGQLMLEERGHAEIRLGDSSSIRLEDDSVDFVLTSPPYCTRIDYTAATRVELAVLSPLLTMTAADLSRQMTGSIRVPIRQIAPSDKWGKTCNKFLRAVYDHASKASKTYYYKTHLDYFDKTSRSIDMISTAMKKDATAVFVVQDSFYKDIHNDLPSIVAEMFEANEVHLTRRDNFYVARSMSGINPFTKAYKRGPGATESVLFFKK